MDRNIFDNKKETLRQLFISWNDEMTLATKDYHALAVLIELLDRYNYDNRLEMKGLITRKIIDNLELNYLIGDKFIAFDNSIK